MFIKKIVAGMVTLIIVSSLIATSIISSAEKYTRKEAYNNAYTYSGTAEYMKWTFNGTLSGVSTSVSNSNGKASRYFITSVGSYYATNNTEITSLSNSVTTTNAGTGVGMPREPKNKYIYYRHEAICKTDKENLQNIADIIYRVYQIKY